MHCVHVNLLAPQRAMPPSTHHYLARSPRLPPTSSNPSPLNIHPTVLDLSTQQQIKQNTLEALPPPHHQQHPLQQCELRHSTPALRTTPALPRLHKRPQAAGKSIRRPVTQVHSHHLEEDAAALRSTCQCLTSRASVEAGTMRISLERHKASDPLGTGT
ncbi:hypothetical protein BU23DRAFT_206611 [Bimuria novae-zelandiae CBS 107.79]|uniref:Uncharacterized protein n=1 Tax=Bimuria novae-zelandiae CBS 107.79 TaxID=1447943 RepID=A0A6A5UZT8_9PLEO|nr:hypothetical protein BU23DRAFT_206611 [Bimuria novae-zelandiae CBS 107.79]